MNKLTCVTGSSLCFFKHHALNQHPRFALTHRSFASKKIFDDSDEKTRETIKDIDDIKEKEIYVEYTQKGKAAVFDKKPQKYECIEGKAYFWCSCGRSHKQVHSNPS